MEVRVVETFDIIKEAFICDDLLQHTVFGGHKHNNDGLVTSGSLY